jgi:hypothetical protein
MRPDRSPLLIYLLLVLGPFATGCTDWRGQQVEPAQWIAQTHPAEVRLEQRDGSKVTLRSPTVLGTAIRGLRGRDTVEVAVADVTGVAAKRRDWLETTLLIAAPPALLFGLACLAACGY